VKRARALRGPQRLVFTRAINRIGQIIFKGCNDFPQQTDPKLDGMISEMVMACVEFGLDEALQDLASSSHGSLSEQAISAFAKLRHALDLDKMKHM
jgi:hypothetical protein